ncbi:Zinc finger, RING-type [Dillenia turbinata]|uniref:Zinc finger, RING-type n=1 Tax=Dillenia turbinata TaxID=194707 RepID=A0AAN8UY91_9MAGN
MVVLGGGGGGGSPGGLWWSNFGRRKRRPSSNSKPSDSVDVNGPSGYRFPLRQAATAASLAFAGDTIAQFRERYRRNSTLKDEKFANALRCTMGSPFLVLADWKRVSARWVVAKQPSLEGSFRLSLISFSQDVMWLLSDHDWLRALRMTSYGFLFYGPGSYAWYQYLDHCLPRQSVENLLLKVLLNQIILGPAVITVVFAWNNLWLGKLSELPNKYKKDALRTLFYGFRFWIPVSALNFGSGKGGSSSSSCCIHVIGLHILELCVVINCEQVVDLLCSICLWLGVWPKGQGVAQLQEQDPKSSFAISGIKKQADMRMNHGGHQRQDQHQDQEIGDHFCGINFDLFSVTFVLVLLVNVVPIPVQPQPQPVRILFFSDGTRRELEPSFAHPQFIPDFPRHTNYEEESRLSQEEQKKALKKLKKEVYIPTPKRIPRRVNLYYRDINPISKGKVAMDEDGKRCAVCLEDFEAREEVMLTPCSHMFHEDCIVPWVKSHGRCPVCRAPFSEHTRFSSMPNNVVPNMGGVADDLFAGELISIIRAMNEVI